MRELTDDLIRNVCAGYGMDASQHQVCGTLAQMRTLMEWARMEGRTEALREHLVAEQERTYGKPANS
jgi:hypothetical protein